MRRLILAWLLVPFAAVAQTVHPVSMEPADQWRAEKQRLDQSSKVVTTMGARLTPVIQSVDQPASQPQRVRQAAGRREASQRISTIYGILLYKNTWGNSEKYAVNSFQPLESSTVKTVYSDATRLGATGGACYVNGKYHVVKYSNIYSITFGNYYLFNTEDWSVIEATSISDNYMVGTDPTYDPATGNVYSVMYTEDYSGFVFGTIDYATKTRKVISTVDQNMLAMAATNEGTIYAVRADGKLVRFDKTNGKYTVIGSTGITPMYLQSAAVDPKTNKMYWAACTSDGSGNGLYEVNTETGAATLILKFNNNEEYGGLYIPAPLADDEAPDQTKQLSATFLRDSLSGTVKFTMPTLTYGGDEITADMQYKVMLNGTVKASGTAAPGTKVTETVTADSAGWYDITACAVNSVGDGPASKVSKWIGMDHPKAVGSLKLNISDQTAKLTWTAPTAGVHAGYIDKTQLNYSILRLPDSLIVSDHQTERTFTETLSPADRTNYYYEVTAFVGGIEGEKAASNRVAVGDGVSIPYYDGFDDLTTFTNMFTVIDANNDKVTWTADNYNGPGQAAVYERNENKDADDWLLTPALKLKNDRYYNFEFQACTSWLTSSEIVEAFLGTDKTVASMTTRLVEKTTVTGENRVTLRGTAKVPAEGLYYMGIHVCSPASEFTLFVDDISVTEGALFIAPDSATQLSVAAGSRGAASATVSFRAPTTDCNGKALTAISKIEILRGDSIVSTITQPEVGSSQTFTETGVPTGTARYEVRAYNENGVGLSASAETWVGIDVPTEVQNLTLKSTDSKAVLTWDAPTTGIHGGYINPSALTYNIEDNRYYIKGDHRAGTTYTETISGEQRLLYYRVAAQSATGGGNYVYSDTVLAGAPYTLPFTESFPKASATHFWTGQHTGSMEMGYTEGVCADNDGGAAIMLPKAKGERGIFTSGKIKISSAKQPTLEFYYYAVPGKQVNLSVCVVPDGDSNQLALLKSIDYTALSGEEGWRKTSVPLDDYKSASYVMLTFVGTATGANYDNIAFDAITVRNQYDADLSVEAEAPTFISFGTKPVITASVSNEGRQSMDNYQVMLYQGGKAIDSIAGRQLPVDSSATYEFQLAHSTVDKKTATYQVRITADNDGNKSNNRSSYMRVTFEESPLPAPTAVDGHYLESKESSLTWTTPDFTTGEYRRTDGFDDYTAFSISGFGPWTTIDKDGGITHGLQTSDGSTIRYDHVGEPMAWQVFNPSAAGINSEAFTPHSGKQMLASIVEANGKADDWLVSPELSGDAQTIDFWIRSVSADYLEQFEVLWSEDSDEYQKVSISYDAAPAEWTHVEAELPDGARRFAIRKTSAKFMLMLDDVSYALFNASTLQLLGYNVYRDGVKVGFVKTPFFAEKLDTTSCKYQITAVYELGESQPADCDIDAVTAIATPTTEGSAERRIYDLSGRRVSEPAKRGVYIIDGRKTVVN